jgi:hypothetical protein
MFENDLLKISENLVFFFKAIANFGLQRLYNANCDHATTKIKKFENFGTFFISWPLS